MSIINDCTQQICGILSPKDRVDAKVLLEPMDKVSATQNRISVEYTLLEDSYTGSGFDMKFFTDCGVIQRTQARPFAVCVSFVCEFRIEFVYHSTNIFSNKIKS